ncbi:BnaC03g31030D [Brassica napus]|uniref:BnaC03g31030D protein n=1 Tax=Brassica napus TaxID=3708 RepID=A0A078FYI4_BRANA|nr:BnaC03g31030D [Brassica napus]
MLSGGIWRSGGSRERR